MKTPRLLLLALVCLLSAGSVQGQRTASPLLQRLKTLERRGVLFGHQDDPFYGLGWKRETGRSDVLSTCGDRPAVLGIELGGLELGDTVNLDGVGFATMQREAIAHIQRGGIVTVSWHPRNPLTGGDAWDVTRRDAVRSVLPGGERHEMFVGWLQRVGQFLRLLPMDGVIFRPWHENNGSWFWWGEELCTAQEYLSLWCMTQDSLIASGLTGLVWSYSPNLTGSLTREAFLVRYPGDERVDLIGLDAYQNGTADEFLAQTRHDLKVLSRYCRRRDKRLALTECGLRGVTHAQWWTTVLLPLMRDHRLSYALVWRNEDEREIFGPWPTAPHAADFRALHANSRTLFLRDIQRNSEAEQNY